MRYTRPLFTTAFAVAALIGAGCQHKTPAPTAARAPMPAATTAAAPTPQPAPHQSTATTTTAAAVPEHRIPNAATRARIDTLLARIEDAYFDYDRHTLRPDAIKTLEADSKELRDIIVQYPDYHLKIEGHCDERGSEEYNLALGQARADSAKAYLVGVGIPSAQLAVISYGKDKPACDEHDEACWQKNRRIHIVAEAK